MSDDVYSLHSLTETEDPESKCTFLVFFLHKRCRYLGHVVALADSVHSVGIVSELTVLETVPPLEIPPAQPEIAEPQPDPGHTVGQPVNVPYLPQCKYYLPIVQFSLKSLYFSSLFHPVADFSPFGI